MSSVETPTTARPTPTAPRDTAPTAVTVVPSVQTGARATTPMKVRATERAAVAFAAPAIERPGAIALTGKRDMPCPCGIRQFRLPTAATSGRLLRSTDAATASALTAAIATTAEVVATATTTVTAIITAAAAAASAAAVEIAAAAAPMIHITVFEAVGMIARVAGRPVACTPPVAAAAMATSAALLQMRLESASLTIGAIRANASVSAMR